MRKRREELEDQERDAIGATGERRQLAGNEAEESRNERSCFIDVDFFFVKRNDDSRLQHRASFRGNEG